MSPSPELYPGADQAVTGQHQPSGRRVGVPIHHGGRRRAAKFGAATAVAVTFALAFYPEDAFTYA